MFQVRRATLDDVDSIYKITQDAFYKYIKLAGIEDTAALHETREQIIEDINTKIVYVAYIKEHVVGSVRIELLGDGEAYLSRFGVNTDFQNMGIGKAMMNSLDIELKELGVKRVVLHTASKATPLMRFYYNRGFYVDSTTKDKGYIRAFLVKDLA